ncbi:effector-associated constant component EACC1 [Actinomadura verrucosospora]|uniref:Uncharacterized protein n=1 Tax=Actinomadura verrucosospora TaxID=46165 RepID=A0A7D3VSM8_ACTVE|nr:hypothetical protein [Actinomadura verrucosospora]QKG19814.1 hypothetical protein ACTIVE_1450 [Actinomadura verrucosospora]
MTPPLSDRSVVLSLQEITEDLSADRDYAPADVDEARALLDALLAAADRSAAALPERPGEQAARALLTELAADPDTAGRAAAVLADPPADEQLGIEAAATSVVVIAGLVTWLQTKITIRVRHRDGDWEFDFRLDKQPVPASVLRRLADTVARVLGSPSDEP